jgi:RHS repeat-associated protein
MAGDKFNVRVSSWYYKNGVTPQTPYNPLSDLISALAGSIGSVGGSKATTSQLTGNNVLNPGATSYYSSHNTADSTTKPKAFLNWVVFDEQFNYVSSSSGFDQVGSDNALAVLGHNGLSINKNGYLYVYVSNETPNIDVYFDNLQVTHIRGPLLQVEGYYPFGLEMSGISSNALSFASPNNTYKFNGGDEWEESINLYSTFFRGYDPQLGRFNGIDILNEKNNCISPYQFALNNPLLFNDPRGDKEITQEDIDAMWNSPNGGQWNSESGLGLFGSQDEAFMVGSIQMEKNGWWGGANGWAGSFSEALDRYNHGSITAPMVAAYYRDMWGSQARNVSAVSLDDGFYLSFTATNTGNSYINTIYTSAEAIKKDFDFVASLFNTNDKGLSTWEILDKLNNGIGIPQTSVMSMATNLIGEERVITTATDGTLNFANQFKNVGQASNKFLKTVDQIGVIGGYIDAGFAWKDFADNQTLGNFAKATGKTILAFVKTNPVVNLITTIADITGLTDWLFDW